MKHTTVVTVILALVACSYAENVAVTCMTNHEIGSPADLDALTKNLMENGVADEKLKCFAGCMMKTCTEGSDGCELTKAVLKAGDDEAEKRCNEILAKGEDDCSTGSQMFENCFSMPK